ncbi:MULTISPECIES: DoxX family membrane protein [Streptomyces]|uniref:DoxX family membrane protein n=1 Tax=Streptomyces TaxID=1883 RepID=UPI001966634A|nr:MULTISPECIES: DoxX family membrane protein [Streptomyces]QRX93726.1 DoxX family membrane protein [Streptomyces noursei]UJB43402.1 DoxX family membrane protein [Streptomyces sp. A1-5]
MSVDTRTPRTPTGGRSSSSFDDEPVLSSVKVPCDPAQVIVNHASFRVQLAAPVVAGRLAETTRVPALRGSPPRRRTPVVWSGRTEPGGTAGATTQLLHAVRDASVGLDRGPAEDVGTTQVLPRVRLGGSPASTVVGPRGPADGEDTLPRGTRAVAARLPGQRYDDEDGRDDERFEMRDSYDTGVRRRGGDSVRHAYYPGRRMNLGVVLLPLRIFLGLISVYAGMGKLCDPVYFDGGQRGSMVTWLLSLHPWELAVPLRDFAVAHPVGAGLTVAFLQVVVGVLTICGLWQRVAASFGALLSAALLMTVSWRTLPAYDAPDIIYLAAWSPLIIAGAPVYSMDARLAGEAWRRLGPRVEVGALRRRVLRRGAVMTAVVAGLTLLIGSLLGGAVRTARVPTVPRPGEPAINNLPGSPLPRPGHHAARPGHRIPGHPGAPSTSASHKAHKPGTPSASAPGSPSAGGHTGSSARRPGATSSAPQLSGPSRTPGRTQSPAGSGGTGGGTSGGSSSGAPGGDSGRGSTLGGLLG